MLRLVLILSAFGWLSACSPYKAIRKPNEEFKKLCESVMGDALATSTTNQTETASLRPRLIAPGMQIAVTVAEDASLNRAYLVPTGCAVEFPAVGRLQVCGLTMEELANNIREALEKDYFQKATVSVSFESAGTAERPTGAGGGCVVYLIGDINRPGPLLLPPNENFTLTKAIIAAGNFTQFAKSTSVRVIRYCEDGKKYETYVNVKQIMDHGEFERDVPLRCNDWVIVGQKIISF